MVAHRADLLSLLLLIFKLMSTVVCQRLVSLPWPWPPHEHPTGQWTVAAYASAYLGASYLVELLRELADDHPRRCSGPGWGFSAAARR